MVLPYNVYRPEIQIKEINFQSVPLLVALPNPREIESKISSNPVMQQSQVHKISLSFIGIAGII